jgi:hypothetical protein
LDEDEEIFNKSYIMTCPNIFKRHVMKKTVLNILYLIIGVILMCIAIIPLVQLSGLNTPIYLKESSKISIFRYMFLYMFLSINFLIPGLNLFLNNKIKKIVSVSRTIYIAITVFLFIRTLFTILFPLYTPLPAFLW